MSEFYAPVVLKVLVMITILDVVKSAQTAPTITWTSYLQHQALRFAYQLNGHSVQKRGTDRQGQAKLAFEQCGEDGDPVYVKNFMIEPNPVVVPGPIGVGMTLDVKQNQTAPLPGEYKLLPVVFQISRLPDSVPTYLLEGQFYIKAELIKEDKHLACYSTTITLEL
ncbi:uncharacterized protein LOC111086897 [Limulus polyphemus]|uniref:Uncharacterized protein LOC111086897 n=1 Tax=Limulus polyphemus TaxID=6850 RepID=A0ABM1SUM3_LIMPO|nr:uncharacterized protein LOC111086897 [Limulus polyphemus]